ncbi:MAG TPA: NeuD/PglB/VioB family sugar acetyltransferase [Bacillota bacterium]|nr:NeuD/PglB/VioB family sugar acetyltransferase [Bacillota bacterium]
MQVYPKYFKRLFDFCAALAALVILSPLLVLISLAVVLDSGFPVFFSQWRTGREGRQFLILKFRTMTRAQNGAGNACPFPGNDEARITRVGRVLRSFSLDELPQLFNVLKGDMSLVGPRPTLHYQVQRYDSRQRRRLLMKPGLTGWAQVNGRNLLSWRERIELDLWYIDHCSFLLDLKILLKTLGVVLKRQGSDTAGLDEISAREEVVIAGAGGHGRVVADALQVACADKHFLGFVDDNQELRGQKAGGFPVLGSIADIPELYREHPALLAVLAIGDNSVRETVAKKLSSSKVKFAKIIHPGATIAGDVTIGQGTVVLAGAVINSGAKIGSHVIINTSAVIEHDCIVKDYAHISPGAKLGGGVKIEEGAQIGIGAVVLPGRKVGSRALVGAGAVVVKDIPANVVAMGIPARVAGKKEQVN